MLPQRWLTYKGTYKGTHTIAGYHMVVEKEEGRGKMH